MYQVFFGSRGKHVTLFCQYWGFSFWRIPEVDAQNLPQGRLAFAKSNSHASRQDTKWD